MLFLSHSIALCSYLSAKDFVNYQIINPSETPVVTNENLSLDNYKIIRDKQITIFRQSFGQVTCTCLGFKRNYVCSHTYLFDCANDIRNRQAELYLLSLTPAKKRGRPSNICSAWRR